MGLGHWSRRGLTPFPCRTKISRFQGALKPLLRLSQFGDGKIIEVGRGSTSQGSLVFGKRLGFGLQRKPRDARPQASMASLSPGVSCVKWE